METPAAVAEGNTLNPHDKFKWDPKVLGECANQSCQSFDCKMPAHATRRKEKGDAGLKGLPEKCTGYWTGQMTMTWESLSLGSVVIARGWRAGCCLRCLTTGVLGPLL